MIESGQRIVPAWELQNELIGLCGCYQPSSPPFIDATVDTAYWLPSRKFVEGSSEGGFSHLVAKLNSRYGMFWQQNRMDCDKFVAMAISWMLLCYWRSDAGGNAAVAFLRATVRIKTELNGMPKGNHCTVVCRTAEGWIFYEPQNQRSTPLEPVLAGGSAVLCMVSL